MAGSFAPLRDTPRMAPASAYDAMYREVARDQGAAGSQLVNHPLDTAANCATNFLAMEGQVLQEAFIDPFTNVPENPAAIPGHILTSVLGVVGVVEQMQYAGIAALTAPLAAMTVPLPVLTLTSMGLGIPHTHVHPPSLIPPAPPCPMPSLGMMLIPGAINVLVGGLPAARAGDVGMIVTCVSFGPPVEVVAGSSNTFFGGNRGARVGTDFFFHDNPTPMSNFAAAMMIAGAAASYATAIGQAAEGNFGAAAMSVAQQQADLAAMALKELRKIDPGAPPDMGMFLTGEFTVLVGGFPLPPAMDIAAIVGKLRGLASRVARRFRGDTDDAARGRRGGDDDGDTCGTSNCPRGG